MNIKYIEKLVKILESSTISEIEVGDFWGRKITVRKAPTETVKTPPTHAVTAPPIEKITAPEKPVEEKPLETKKNFVAIRSPIVGTFYRAPAPDAPPYVEVGDTVKPGQVVCLVEAMKLMNEIESDVAGRVVQILLKNEDPVEYNQELLLIEPL